MPDLPSKRMEGLPQANETPRVQLTASAAELEAKTRVLEMESAELRALGRGVIEEARREIERLRHMVLQREEKIRSMQHTLSWRLTGPLRAVRRAVFDRFVRKEAARILDQSLLPISDFRYSPSDFDEVGAEFSFGIDYPRSWGSLLGQVKAKGWCVPRFQSELTGIRAQIGARTYEGKFGEPHPDAPQFDGQPLAAGFSIQFEVEPNDRAVSLQVGDRAGQWHPFLIRHIHRPSDHGAYARWIERHERLLPADVQKVRARVNALQSRPRISVIMPVYNTPERFLARAIESVRSQLYDNWELCIADDASPLPHVRQVLNEATRKDPRIKVVFRPTNGHISEASNSALALATGAYVALLDHDDELQSHALACVALELDRHPEAVLLYSDEDKLTEEGTRSNPYFKPDWNPDLLHAQNFICHLAVYRTDLVRGVGGFRVGYEGSQDWDLALRVIEQIEPQQIRHIPRILYHWREAPGSTAIRTSEKCYSVEAARKALTDHFARCRIAADLTATRGNYWRVRYELPSPAPRVSLIIPTRNGESLLRACVSSLLQKTSYENWEIIVVDNGSNEAATTQYLDELRVTPRCRVIAYPGDFNFSAINNYAVSQTAAEIIGLLNNDLEVISENWLHEMVSHACRPEIGCVGAKLYYPDGRIQHAGLILGIGGMAGHSWHGFPGHTPGQGYRACLAQNVSAVTGACLVVRRSVYREVGGLDETQFKVALNDVDFCLKVRAAGYRNLFTPFAELYHHESATRGYEDNPSKRARFERELELLQKKWGDALFADPAYNPNLTLEHVDFALAFPPRVPPLSSL